MPSYPRSDAHRPTVRFHDASRQHPIPAEEQGTYVHFDPVRREHDFFVEDPPARSNWAEEPPSPHIPTRSLPDLAELRLTERSSRDSTPTPANSPETHTASLSRNTGRDAYAPASPSPPSSPEPQPDVSVHLAGPGLNWNVRGRDLDPSFIPTHGLDRPAFTSKRKSCTLRFLVDETNEWTVDVPPRTDASPLSVWDVLWAIRCSLFSRVEQSALIPSDARYPGAVEERPLRLHGAEDARGNVFRNVDFYPAATHSYFHGLVEEFPGKEIGQFVVNMGPKPKP